MSFPDPTKDSYSLIFITAIIAAIVTWMITKFADYFMKYIRKPFELIFNAVYMRIAPRNPLSISLNTYKRAIKRSNLARIETPVGPAINVPLEYAYAPLRLISAHIQQELELFQYAADNRRFIVLGGPGTGKTTLMKGLTLAIINKHCHDTLNALIPVFIVLRRLAAAQHSVEDAIIAAFNQYNFPRSLQFVHKSISEGRLLVILDGLDEVGESRTFVTDQIQQFCEQDDVRDNKNRIVVTCREHSYRTEDLRNVIPNIVRVEPFSNHHMRVFLKGWPSYQGRSALSLYADIQENTYIQDICRNPLLLTILTGLYLESDYFRLPTSRDEFYKAAIDELLEKRPARRGIQQEFRPDIKRQVLMRASLERLELADLHEDSEILKREDLIRHALDVLQLERNEFRDSIFIDELVTINGVIKPADDSDSVYACAHRTFQEYFAANDAIRVRRAEYMLHRFGQRNDLIEVLFFYCGLLANVDDMKDIVRAFMDQKAYQRAGECLLNITETLEEGLIINVVEGMFNTLINAKMYSSQELNTLGILASLSQRPWSSV